MSLSNSEFALVKDSLDRLRKDYDAYSMFFYEALFRRAPETRKMFRDDLAGQGMKFMTTLDVIVRKLDQQEELAERFIGLGRTHKLLGISAEAFKQMEEALIDTIRHVMGEDSSEELEAAWRKAYEIVSANMMQRGGIKDD